MDSRPESVPEDTSLRSRASSVVTTGTKFSFSTLPQEDRRHNDNVDGVPGYSAVRGPRSIFSVASHETSLPPYENLHDERIAEASMGHQVKSATEQPVPETADPSPTSPTIDPENALSMHYGRVVRTIDQNHMNQMRRLREDLDAMKQAHQEEMGAIRHAIDQAYRKELKAKNREVEKTREEMASQSAEHDAAMASLSAEHDATIARLQREALEQSTEQAQAHQIGMDKACNAIEDMWEARWNDRIRLAFEETKKMDASYQKRLQEVIIGRDQAVEDANNARHERDQAWVQALSTKYPELSEELEGIPAALSLNVKD